MIFILYVFGYHYIITIMSGYFKYKRKVQKEEEDYILKQLETDIPKELNKMKNSSKLYTSIVLEYDCRSCDIYDSFKRNILEIGRPYGFKAVRLNPSERRRWYGRRQRVYEVELVSW